jgi:hypothetical protein
MQKQFIATLSHIYGKSRFLVSLYLFFQSNLPYLYIYVCVCVCVCVYIYIHCYAI